MVVPELRLILDRVVEGGLRDDPVKFSLPEQDDHAATEGVFRSFYQPLGHGRRPGQDDAQGGVVARLEIGMLKQREDHGRDNQGGVGAFALDELQHQRGLEGRRENIGATRIERRHRSHDRAADVKHRHGVQPDPTVRKSGLAMKRVELTVPR